MGAVTLKLWFSTVMILCALTKLALRSKGGGEAVVTHTFEPNTLALTLLILVLGRYRPLIPELGRWRQGYKVGGDGISATYCQPLI